MATPSGLILPHVQRLCLNVCGDMLCDGPKGHDDGCTFTPAVKIARQLEDQIISLARYVVDTTDELRELRDGHQTEGRVVIPVTWSTRAAIDPVKEYGAPENWREIEPDPEMWSDAGGFMPDPAETSLRLTAAEARALWSYFEANESLPWWEQGPALGSLQDKLKSWMKDES